MDSREPFRKTETSGVVLVVVLVVVVVVVVVVDVAVVVVLSDKTFSSFTTKTSIN